MTKSADIPNYDEMWTQVYGEMQDFGPTHRHMRRIIRSLLNGMDYSSALDVGCGAGHNLPLLSAGRKLSKIVGCDISARALERARNNYLAEFHRLDIQRGQVQGKYELVFCSLLLEHLPDDVAALLNMRRMSTKWLLVVTIAGDFERYRVWDETQGHVRNYLIGELEDKVQAAGFVVDRVIYWGFPFYAPIVRTLQNYAKVKSSLGLGGRLIAEMLYLLYFLNSFRKGDLLFISAHVQEE